MNTNTARQECATLIKFCTLCSELHTDAALLFCGLLAAKIPFVGCQNSTNFKLASLGMRGAQERALLVSDTNCKTISEPTVVVPEFRYKQQ